jgi:hypothetical protein
MAVSLYSDNNFKITVSEAEQAKGKRLRFNNNKPTPPVTTRQSPGFTVIRELGKIAFEDADAPDNFPKALGKTVTITFYYTQADLNAAGASALSLGYWNGTAWVKFATPNRVAKDEGGNAGYANVNFTSTPWDGDPPVAWGK